MLQLVIKAEKIRKRIEDVEWNKRLIVSAYSLKRINKNASAAELRKHF